MSKILKSRSFWHVRMHIYVCWNWSFIRVRKGASHFLGLTHCLTETQRHRDHREINFFLCVLCISVREKFLYRKIWRVQFQQTFIFFDNIQNLKIKEFLTCQDAYICLLEVNIFETRLKFVVNKIINPKFYDTLIVEMTNTANAIRK